MLYDTYIEMANNGSIPFEETVEYLRKGILQSIRKASHTIAKLPFNDPNLDAIVLSRVDVEQEMRAAFELLMRQYSTHTENLLNAQRMRDVYVERVAEFDATKVKDLPDDMIYTITEFIGSNYVRLTSLVASVPIYDILKRASKDILLRLRSSIYDNIMAVYRKECNHVRRKYPNRFSSAKYNIQWHTRTLAGEWEKSPSQTKAKYIADIQRMITRMIDLTDTIPTYLSKGLVGGVRIALIILIQIDKTYHRRIAARTAARRDARKAAAAAAAAAT